jgi:hypothetical protein
MRGAGQGLRADVHRRSARSAAETRCSRFEDANHFNDSLQKCLVETLDREEFEGGLNTWIYVLNAYERTNLMQCLN